MEGRSWSVHDGQMFADSVWANSPRAPNERRALNKHNSSPNSVLDVRTCPAADRAVAEMWLTRLPPVEKIKDKSTQTPALSRAAEAELQRLAIAEDVRRANGDAPPKMRRFESDGNIVRSVAPFPLTFPH